MYVIKVDDVNQAIVKGVNLLVNHGEIISSRAGRTLEVPAPVTTVYNEPWKRVLIDKERDANPFFHLMESMWILAGRKDVNFLCEFNKRMREYSDDGNEFNAPYGYRLRFAPVSSQDQISGIIKDLKSNPQSRQAIGQIWTDTDLGKSTLDKACNMSVVFRIRNGKLCLTVYNRSNDMLWGAYGANVVQFSMLQEYVAAKLNLEMGTYHQVSNSYHVYLDGPGGALWDKMRSRVNKFLPSRPYDSVKTIVRMKPHEMPSIDYDLFTMFKMYDQGNLNSLSQPLHYSSSYFKTLVAPMMNLWLKYKGGSSLEELQSYASMIAADDWRTASMDFITNRKTV